ncbi:hypothetical protein JCM3775_001071 [Rhodotorula graminis]|uniref:60S ribosomal protein L29 n=1 Tax=Rhodotorula graminis (strain WP1) TaxID=578459 RepID=A0A194SCV4_RHOGW|nr:uncharacterized protein RHOBADRAFT_64405 [Rhodotorula graminis WP1]KPV78422.1 hypothetical protein RHOBADRAFT_64405 [Rhodotorula graminis WP1]
MSKSKNHTNHNQNKKAHKNGLKKPASTRERYANQRGVDPKFRRNARYASQGTQKVVAAERAAKAASA